MTAEALELSRELAESLRPRIRREGRVFTVPAELAPPAKYRRSGRDHEVTLAYDGALICRCAASAFGRECWATDEVRKVLNMTEETSLTIAPLSLQRPVSLLPSESELTRMSKVAEIILAGGVDLPKELNTPEKIMAVMLKGRALGLDPTIAIDHIHYIDGHAVPDAQILAGILARDVPDSKLLLEKEVADYSVTMRLILPSRGIDACYTVTMDDADVKVLVERDTPHQARSRDGGTYNTKPGGWVMYPRDRLRWHATKRLLKIYAPDVINGLVNYGIGEFTERGEPEMTVIDGQVVHRETGEVMGPEAQQPDEGAQADQSPPARAATPAAPAPPAETKATPAQQFWQRVRSHGLNEDWVRDTSQRRFNGREPEKLTGTELLELWKGVKEGPEQEPSRDIFGATPMATVE